MNLFSFNYTKANPTDHPTQYKAGTREWRWTCAARKYYFGFFEQTKTTYSDWHDMLHRHYYVAWNTKDSRWGRYHDYYDGPLDSFCLGRLQFHWSGDWCNKCMPDD